MTFTILFVIINSNYTFYLSCCCYYYSTSIYCNFCMYNKYFIFIFFLEINRKIRRMDPSKIYLYYPAVSMFNMSSKESSSQQQHMSCSQQLCSQKSVMYKNYRVSQKMSTCRKWSLKYDNSNIRNFGL